MSFNGHKTSCALMVPFLCFPFWNLMCFGGPKSLMLFNGTFPSWNLMCFDGPTFVPPLQKPHVFWWTIYLMWFYGPNQILPIFHHLMWFDGPKKLMWFDGPKSSFSPFKTSCVLMDPKPHVIWWTLIRVFKVFPSQNLMCFDGPTTQLKPHVF